MTTQSFIPDKNLQVSRKICPKYVERKYKEIKQKAGRPLSAVENKCEGDAIVSLSVHQTNLESVWEDLCTAG